jgi:hypothetical protein
MVYIFILGFALRIDMWEAKLCSACRKGYMMLTGNGLDEFRCNNPECNQRVVDKHLFEKVKSGDSADITHYRDEDGD